MSSSFNEDMQRKVSQTTQPQCTSMHEGTASPPKAPATLSEQLESTNANSIIGKVKLRVSNIIPDLLNNWLLSPSATATAATTSINRTKHQNGNVSAISSKEPRNAASLSEVSRKRPRRRIQLDADNDASEGFGIDDGLDAADLDYEEVALADNIAEHDLAADEEQIRCNEYETNMLRKGPMCISMVNYARHNDTDTTDEDDDDDDEDEQHSNDNANPEANNKQQTDQGQTINSYEKRRRSMSQPPLKRKRLLTYSDMEATREKNIPLPMQRHGIMMSSTPALSDLSSSHPIARGPSSTHQLSYLNPYGHQEPRESPYNCMEQVNVVTSGANEAAIATSGDLPDTEQPAVSGGRIYGMSKRRSLNIAPLTEQRLSNARYEYLPNYKRQALGISQPPWRTSTTIDDVESYPVYDPVYESSETGPTNNNNNNIINVNKRSCEAAVGSEAHSETESNESQPLAPGIPHAYNYNNTHFDFYGNLQSRKSIFNNSGDGGLRSAMAHHNSTLSLNSLSRRRRFNASVYGSSSALSDSRLLSSAVSPFFKGNTLYGGSLGNKRDVSRILNSTSNLTNDSQELSNLTPSTSQMTSFVMKPTGIRPTSSLSNPGTDLYNGKPNPQAHLSTMARRIFNLLNNHTTPLNDARKMGTAIRERQQLYQNRFIRGQTPYQRPNALQDNKKSISKDGPSTSLIVPTMKELLERRHLTHISKVSLDILQSGKAENSLGRARIQPSKNNAMTAQINSKEEVQQLKPSHQSMHTNKMRTRLSHQTRSKEPRDELDSEPVNLPNIAFPTMSSVPKFDLMIPKMPTVVQSAEQKSTGLKVIPDTSGNVNFNFTEPLTLDASGLNPLPSTKDIIAEQPKLNFIFTPPSPLDCVNVELNGNISSGAITKMQQTTPKLYTTGSVLDVLPKKLNSKNNTTKDPTIAGFGEQFKKAASEWECDTCMVRNKVELSKCIACETPRPGQTTKTNVPAVDFVKAHVTSSFGDRFKKPANSWDCEACMVTNKADVETCVACTTSRKSIKTTNSVATTGPLATANSFGNAFKPKSNSWECSVCMIINESSADECVACQNPNPNAASSNKKDPINSTFKFGFNKSVTETPPKQDAGFKDLTDSQKNSTWECDTCLARNYMSLSKCICCDQSKPSSGPATIPRFSFGSSNAVGDTSLKTTKETPAGEINVTQANVLPVTPFQLGFGAIESIKNAGEKTPGTSGLVFGAQNATHNKQTATTTAQLTSSFKFGTRDGQKNVSFTSASSNLFTFGSPAAITTSSTNATTTAIANAIPSPVVYTTSLAGSSSTVSSTTASSSTDIRIKPTANLFTFGKAAATATSTLSITSSNTTVTNSTAHFFDNPTTSTSATVTSSNVVTLPMSTTATTSASAGTPVFSLLPSATSLLSSSGSPTISASSSSATSPQLAFGKGTNTSNTSTTPFAFGKTTPTGGAEATTIGNNNMVTKSNYFFGAPAATLTSTAPSTVMATTNANSIGSIFRTPLSSKSPSIDLVTAGVVVTTAPVGAGLRAEGGSTVTAAGPPSMQFTFGSNTTGLTSPFSFGSSKPQVTEAASTAAMNSTSGGNSPFTFSWPNASNTNSSIANSSTSTSLTVSPSTVVPPVFGCKNSIFGTNATTMPSLSMPFGAANRTPATNNVSPVSVPSAVQPFGNSTFGTQQPISSIFGATSEMPPTNTFGGFGSFSIAPSTTASIIPAKPAFNFGNTTNTGLNFNFGGCNSSTDAVGQSNSSGNLKPAFDFSGAASNSLQPAYNFTATATTNSVATDAFPSQRCFQFGTPASAPDAAPPKNQLFNFTATSPQMQSTPNAAPFQFNAGVTPSTNIFAFNPTAGANAQNSQQARRKIRASNRRLPPR